MFLNRRNFLLGIGAFIFFSKKSFSNQNSLKELMRKQFLGSNDAPIMFAISGLILLSEKLNIPAIPHINLTLML